MTVREMEVKDGVLVMPSAWDLSASAVRRRLEAERARRRAALPPVPRPPALKRCFVEALVFLYDRTPLRRRHPHLAS